jgi:hypothetical protein
VPPGVEDIDYHAPGGLDRVLFLGLSACSCVPQHRNLLVTGSTGINKSWIAPPQGLPREPLGLYQRVSRLIATPALSGGTTAMLSCFA